MRVSIIIGSKPEATGPGHVESQLVRCKKKNDITPAKHPFHQLIRETQVQL